MFSPQSLRGYQAEGLHLLGHWYVCGRPGGKYHQEPAQSAPCVHTGQGEESRSSHNSTCWLFQPTYCPFFRCSDITFSVIPSSRRACTEWRTRSSWASLASWATAVWRMWSTWPWSLMRRSSWWRALRPCGESRRSSLCEKPSSESSAETTPNTLWSTAYSCASCCPNRRMKTSWISNKAKCL